MKRRTITLALSALLAAMSMSGASAVAQEAATAEAEETDQQIDNASHPDGYVDPGMEIEKAFNRFFSEGIGKDLQQRMAAGELYVGKAWAEVQVKPDNSQWGKYRVMAYETALSKAENDYLMALNMTIKATKLRKYFADNSGEVPEFDDSQLRNEDRLKRLIDKLLTVAEGKLDQELQELGIDPGEFSKATPAQRHALFSEALTKTTVKEATGSLAGLLPIQTFEAQNKSREHVIGVVVVASDKMRELAHGIATQRGKIAANPDKKDESVYERIAKDDGLLIDQFGIRRLYDENGYPVLVSYGQWANAYHGDNNIQLRRQRATAVEQARAQADHQIAMFVAGNAMVTEESTTGQLVQQFVDVHKDGYKEERDIARIIDEIRKQSEARANTNLSGLTDLYTWVKPHPLYKDQEIVGVVRVWNPLNERNMRALKDWRPKAQEPASAGQDTDNGGNQVRASKAYMRADDF